MVLRAGVFVFSLPLLLSAVLSYAAQSPWFLASATQTVSATIIDADSGSALSNVHLEVQLFPPEHGGRKFLSLLCVPSDKAEPLFSSTPTNDPNGSFSLTARGGDYLVKVAIPQRQPVFGCIHIDTEPEVRSSSARPLHQHFFVRIATSIPSYSGDIVDNSACAPYQPSPCDPLRVSNLVKTKKIELIDSVGNPMHDTRLEFQENTKGKGKLVASVTTNATGVADVSSLLAAGGLLRMLVEFEPVPANFLFSSPKAGHWESRRLSYSIGAVGAI